MTRTSTLALGTLVALSGCGTGDPIPPSPLHVASTTPADGDLDVDVNVTLDVTFTVAVAPSSVEGTNQILLQDGSFAVIAGVVTVDATDPTKVTFDPSQPLADNTTFGFAIRNGVATPKGELVAAPLGVKFSTGSTIAPMPGWPPFDDGASPPPVPGTFVRTNNKQAIGRRDFAGVTLADGRVFLHGGRGTTGGPIATADIYDPLPDTFGPAGTGGAPAARWGHTATRLGNGQVLLVGGETGSTTLADTPMFDPATNAYPASTLTLAAARAQHTATRLNNGQVLVVGGWSGTAALTSCELFNPTTGTWSATGALTTARAWHTATLLNDGRVLVTGGGNGTASLSSCEVYNATTGVWTGSAALSAPRQDHAATLVSTGTFAGLVLVSGGQQAGGASITLSNCAIFDPAGNGGLGTWTATTNQMTVARTGHTATFIPTKEMILIVGGSNQPLPATPGACGALATAELFDPVGNAGTSGLPTVSGAAGASLQGTFTQTADPGGTASVMQAIAQGRAAHVAFLLGNAQVLLAGGTDCNTAGNPYALPTGERYIP